MNKIKLSSSKYNNSTISLSSSRSSSAADNNRLENVLILQGGGSLGAFGCGVFKALANNNIRRGIVAGTSIGGINAAIIAGSKDEKHPEQALEQFWLELSGSFVDLDRGATFPSLPKFVQEMLLPSVIIIILQTHQINKKTILLQQRRQMTRHKNRAAKSFTARLFLEMINVQTSEKENPLTIQNILPQKWTYMYDLSL
jgi:NTE family protein